MQEISYKIVIDGKDSDKSLTTLKNQIITLEKELEKLQKAGRDTEISFGKPNEFKQTEQALINLKNQLTQLLGTNTDVALSFDEVTNNLNQTAGAFVGVTGQAAGLNTALNGTNTVITEQAFAQELLNTNIEKTNQTIESQKNSVESLKNTVNEPIVLDVNVDKDKINELISATGDAEKQLTILDEKNINVTVDNNLPQLTDSAEKTSNTIGSLRKEVLELQNALENTQVGTEEYDKLEKQLIDTSTRLAELKDRTEDLSDSVRTQTGSAFERFNNSLGLLREGIVNLDFGKVQSALNGLGGSIKAALTPSEGLRNAFSNLGKGIVNLDFKTFKSGVDGVGTSFQGLGKAIAATGIGLLVIGVTELITNFDKLKTSGGLIGKIFSGIGDIVSFVTEKITDFARSIGLIGDEEGENTKKRAEQLNNYTTQVEKNYDRQIAIAAAAGKKTTQLERDKTNELIKLANEQKKAIEDRQKRGLASDEEIKQLNELTDKIFEYETTLGVISASEKKVAEDTAAAEKQKRDEKIKTQKLIEENYKKDQQLALDNFNFQNDLLTRLSEEGLITQQELNDQKLENEIKYQEEIRKIEDAFLKQGGLSEPEKERLINLDLEIIKLKEKLKIQQDNTKKTQEESDINNKLIEDRAKINLQYELEKKLTEDLITNGIISQEEGTKRLLALQIKLKENLFEIAKAEAERDGIVTDEELTKLRELNAEIEKLKATAAAPQDGEEGNRNILDALFNPTEEEKQLLIDGALQLGQQISDALLAQANENNQRELENRLEYLDQLEQEELSKIDDLREKGLLNEEQVNARKLAVQKKFDEEAEKARRQAFEKEKKLKLLQATLDFAATIISIQASNAKFGFLGTAIAQIQAGIALANYLAQVAIIKAQKYKFGGQVEKFNEGGLAIGPSHEQGGIQGIVAGQRPIEFEGGEYIINSKAVDKYGTSIFDQLNKMKFANGGQVPSSSAQFIADDFTSVADFSSQLLSTNNSIVPILNQPTQNVVYVSDITDAQNRLNRTSTRISYGN